MSSWFRRAGANILNVIASAADAAAVASQVQVYSKVVSGIAQLFARTSDGTITQLTTMPQVFRYTATGAESNPFTVNLPATRPNTSYNVQLTWGGPAANAMKSARALVASFSTTQFNVELGASLEAGDVLMFTVEQQT